MGELDAHFRLKDRLDAVKGDFEYVVIDCPPTLGLLTVNALVASTHLLIPIQSSYFALEGTDDLLETVDKVRARANPALQIVGVVITMSDAGTTFFTIFSVMSARSCSVETESLCCDETTTVSTRTGLSSTYSTLTCALPSGRR